LNFILFLLKKIEMLFQVKIKDILNNQLTSSNELSNFKLITMSAFQPIIQQGTHGEYYEVNGIKHTGTFPYEWAKDHKCHPFYITYGSGPEFCETCRSDGTINGVFVFYCHNCVKKIYNDTIFPKRHDALHLATDEELWEACPYMQGIPISQIGDKVEDEEVEDEEVKEETQDEYLARVIQEEEEEYLRKLEQEEEEALCQERLRYYEEQEQYEAYRDNDDYYDQWDEPYSREYPITRRELAQLPVDMRGAFDPEYQEGLANFRAAAMQK
jgi:hypothetical protein